jgi:ribosomal protein S17E
MLAKQPQEVRESFETGLRTIERTHIITKKVRNRICGHVLLPGVMKALETIRTGATGKLELDDDANRVSCGFASEIVAEILMEDVPTQERANLGAGIFAGIADLILNTYGLIAAALLIYTKDRGLGTWR